MYTVFYRVYSLSRRLNNENKKTCIKEWSRKKQGSRKVAKKVVDAWTEEQLQEALQEFDSMPNASVRGIAKRHGINESTLRFRLKKRKEGAKLGKSGRKCVFDAETEARLAKYIGVVCNLGFSPTLDEILDLVAEYIKVTGTISLQFKNGRPGLVWIKSFMKRNGLSHKKAEMISTARKANTSNPFIIFDFYDQLEQIFEKYPNLDAQRIWNWDESSFPTDPSKGKVVSVKGQRALKLRYGAGRENITVLGVCNAAGVALDPLIIFTGKNMQSTWYGDKALPNTFYAKSENGWMDTEVFSTWFAKFTEDVTERPLLLVFCPSHLTHISISVIKKALEDDIIIMKFPPHVTDVMQPLDVACFGPLKRAWEKRLHLRVTTHGAKSQLTKSEFVNELCSIWKDGMKKESVINGFRSTGIWPIDKACIQRNAWTQDC
ncbi:uncharacterized protein LOC130644419 [Hydractinia symbiolongicarpus]|uniref:uncharacterized protein LOC130644419 n=1 Tax=Hydractinia symbiolongicarpus TaxID=13093 RepID=UPI0025513747|nr:uncharacterized protein LOC130644419 [Hydractinia symbiolongicarpus]